jgi:hypothetical protein
MLVKHNEWPINPDAVIPADANQYLTYGRVADNFSHAMKLLVENIFSLGVHKEIYADAFIELERIIKYCDKNPEYAFGDSFSIRMRYNILMHNHPSNANNVILSPQNNHATNAEFLFILARHLISQGENAELNHYLDSMNRHAVFSLYEPCFTKTAPDGLTFQFAHTEIQFMENARFTLNNDGRICIPLLGNHAYRRYYARGCEVHDDFKIEMNALTSIMGLKIAADSVYEKNIDAGVEERLEGARLIFDESSSQKLIDNLCHIDRKFVKNLLLLRHEMTRLKQPKEIATEITTLSDLPVPLLQHIERHHKANLMCDVLPGYINAAINFATGRLFELCHQHLNIICRISNTHHLEFVQVVESRDKLIAILRPQENQVLDVDAGNYLKEMKASKKIVRYGNREKPVDYYIISADNTCHIEQYDNDNAIHIVKSLSDIEHLIKDMRPVLPLIEESKLKTDIMPN